MTVLFTKVWEPQETRLPPRPATTEAVTPFPKKGSKPLARPAASSHATVAKTAGTVNTSRKGGKLLTPPTLSDDPASHESKGARPPRSPPGNMSPLWPRFLYLPNGCELLDVVGGASSEAVFTDGLGALQKKVPLHSEEKRYLPSYSWIPSARHAVGAPSERSFTPTWLPSSLTTRVLTVALRLSTPSSPLCKHPRPGPWPPCASLNTPHSLPPQGLCTSNSFHLAVPLERHQCPVLRFTPSSSARPILASPKPV